jgi:hypothetical protein
MARATPLAAMVERMLLEGAAPEAMLNAIEDAELSKQQRPNDPRVSSKTRALTIYSPASRRGMRLPTNWSLPQLCLDYALDHGMDPARIMIESEKFKNYWLAKTGAAATKRDWDATWRNWILNTLERIHGGAHNGWNGMPSTPRRAATGANAVLAGMGRVAHRLVENRMAAGQEERQVARDADITDQLDFEGGRT